MIHTYITTELAIAVGKIAEKYRDDTEASILIEYRDGEPEQHHHVVVDRIDSKIDHLVDDETGEILSTSLQGKVLPS
jgi:hypothetical protein